VFDINSTIFCKTNLNLPAKEKRINGYKQHPQSYPTYIDNFAIVGYNSEGCYY